MSVCAYLVTAYLLEPTFGMTVASLSAFPVVVAGWMTGLYGGILAGVAAIAFNALIMYFYNDLSAQEITSGGFILGTSILILTGGVAGKVREGFARRELAEQRLRARERYLSQLNEITHTIIASQDFDSLMEDLVWKLANLMEADDCYITRWNAEKEQAIPVATTAILDPPCQKMEFPRDQKALTAYALKEGKVVVAGDMNNTPHFSPELTKVHPGKPTICIPLIVGETGVGAVIIAFRGTHKFTEEEIRNAEQAGEQITLALWNARRDNELKRQLRESDAMAGIARALSETERIGLSSMLELIVASAKELIPSADQAVIHSLDGENNLLIPEAVIGFENPQESRAKMHLGEGVAGQAVVNRQTINITDVQIDPRFLNLGVPVKFRSLMVTPIISGERILGTISVQSREPYAFTHNEERLLHALGTHAAIAIDNAHLLESTRQTLRETNALYRISRGLLALDAEELLDDAVDLLEKNLGYHLVQVYLTDPGTREFVLKASSGETRETLQEWDYRLRAGFGIVGHVAETRKPFFTNDVEHVIFHIKNPMKPDIKSEMTVPIQAGDHLLGVLDIQQLEATNFTARDLQIVGIVADQLAASLQKAELYENLQRSLQQEKAIRNQLVQNERLAIMGRLLASVSHELNNPLQAIQNALFLLKEETGLSQQGTNDLEIVLAEAERMAGLIERLRDTYRPPQAEEFQPIHLNAVIEDVYALVATHLRKNEIVFEFLPDFETPPIMALGDQVRQVVLNLLMNAVEAMVNGGKLVVHTKYLKDNHEVMLAVCDTGVGISHAILPYIFDPFVTNKKRGTGIGLTISHDIVMKHRGRIMAENNPDGNGATFKVWLPVRPVSGEIA